MTHAAQHPATADFTPPTDMATVLHDRCGGLPTFEMPTDDGTATVSLEEALASLKAVVTYADPSGNWKVYRFPDYSLFLVGEETYSAVEFENKSFIDMHGQVWRIEQDGIVA